MKTRFIFINPEDPRAVQMSLEVMYQVTPAEPATLTSPANQLAVDIRHVYFHVGYMRMCECSQLIEYFNGFEKLNTILYNSETR